MYCSADPIPVPFVALQYWFGGTTGCAEASKSVPPTAVLNGVVAMPLTASPFTAEFVANEESQPADPLSPLDTTTVIPSAAACSHNELKNWFPVDPSAGSQYP